MLQDVGSSAIGALLWLAPGKIPLLKNTGVFLKAELETNAGKMNQLVS